MSEIDQVVAFAVALGVQRPILLRLTLTRNHQVGRCSREAVPLLTRTSQLFKGGVFFECVRRSKRREVIATGGRRVFAQILICRRQPWLTDWTDRYDSLLELFKAPSKSLSTERVHGVGMAIGIDRLAHLVGRYESEVSNRLMLNEREAERSFGLWSPSRCDVYVASFGEDQLQLRLEVVGELWRAGIAADLQYDDHRDMEEILADCHSQNILLVADRPPPLESWLTALKLRYVVIPRPIPRSIKIKSVLRRTEYEVSRPALCGWVQQAIGEQRKVDMGMASAAVEPPTASDRAGYAPASATDNVRPGEVDIQILLRSDDDREKRKARHVTKVGRERRASTRCVADGFNPLPPL